MLTIIIPDGDDHDNIIFILIILLSDVAFFVFNDRDTYIVSSSSSPVTKYAILNNTLF